MKTIILIEDDEAIRDIFSLALNDTQYRIVFSDSGNPVLMNEFETPDLFIVDKNISGTNGLNICRFIKNNRIYRRAPVIMISADPDIEALAGEAGAADVIKKPFSINFLRDMVAKYTN